MHFKGLQNKEIIVFLLREFAKNSEGKDTLLVNVPRQLNNEYNLTFCKISAFYDMVRYFICVEKKQ